MTGSVTPNSPSPHSTSLEGSVSQALANGVATISFSHPHGNSLPGAVLRNLAQAIEEAGRDDQIRVVVLKSGGEKAFCGGASFDELLDATTLERSRQFFGGFAHVINAMRKCPKLIVARVQGKAAGGGVGVIAAADYVFATAQAAVRLSELALGIGPFIIGPAVQRKIGVAAFSELAIGAEWRDAAWALARGLYNSVSPDSISMDVAMNAFVATLASRNPEAMATLKRILWEGTEEWDAFLGTRVGYTSQLALTDFVKSAVQSARKA